MHKVFRQLKLQYRLLGEQTIIPTELHRYKLVAYPQNQINQICN